MSFKKAGPYPDVCIYTAPETSRVGYVMLLRSDKAAIFLHSQSHGLETNNVRDQCTTSSYSKSVHTHAHTFRHASAKVAIISTMAARHWKYERR